MGREFGTWWGEALNVQLRSWDSARMLKNGGDLPGGQPWARGRGGNTTTGLGHQEEVIPRADWQGPHPCWGTRRA